MADPITGSVGSTCCVRQIVTDQVDPVTQVVLNQRVVLYGQSTGPRVDEIPVGCGRTVNNTHDTLNFEIDPIPLVRVCHQRTTDCGSIDRDIDCRRDACLGMDAVLSVRLNQCRGTCRSLNQDVVDAAGVLGQDTIQPVVVDLRHPVDGTDLHVSV